MPNLNVRRSLGPTDCHTAIMNSPKPHSITAPQILFKLGKHIEHSLIYRVDQNGREHRSGDLEIWFLAKLDRFVWLSLETASAPFKIKYVTRRESETKENGYGQMHTVRWQVYAKTAVPNLSHRVTQELATFLMQFPVNATILNPSDLAAKQLLLAPHLQRLLEVYFNHPIRKYIGHKLGLSEPIDFHAHHIRAEIYNDFVVQFRQAMLARKLLRRERHNWNLGSRENLANLDAYLGDLFVQRNSVTVLHLRLFHARERINLVTGSVEEQHRDLEALRACRKLFFDRMRRSPALFTHTPRYIWSIQPSLEGGYDLHLTLLFDTVALQKVLDDKRVEAEQAGAVLEDHADQVGEYWVRVATGGRGSYLRGDRSHRLYGPDWVHGEVHADAFVQREKLKETLGHLAMRRALVRLKNEPPGQYFGMSELKARAPRRSAKSGVKGR